jgi:oxygen-dependent protoporphyrinogen oxidase
MGRRAERGDSVTAPARVVVVGGGISGLATAHALAGLLPAASIEIEVREATDRLGGKLLTTPFAGLPAVDEGADAFLARVPEGADLARRVGLGHALTAPTDAGAAVLSGGRLHPIPTGLMLGVPAGVVGLAASGLLSWRGKLRAALEPLVPARDPDDSIGALVRGRFGDEVHERLVDALVGAIYAADTDRFSLAMVPQLATLAADGRSLLLSARKRRRTAPPATGPLFFAPSAGMGALAGAVAAAAGENGVTIRTSATVGELAADGSRWRVDGDAADAIVLATPAAATAPLLAAAAPEAARLLATMDHAGVVVVTLAADALPPQFHGYSGYLIPKPEQADVTAVSFGSQKWAHWRPEHGGEILRVSLGRDGLPVPDVDDDDLVDLVVGRVGRHLGVDLRPTEVRVSRWPASFPQYRPHHREWLAGVDAALPPGLFATGASYRGIGVPACIADAEATARTVSAFLHPSV